MQKQLIRLPVWGMGCAALGNLYRAISDQQAAQFLRAAWDAGMRYFDTAPLYGFGLSERRLGDFLRNLADDQADPWQLSTKVGRVLAPDHSHHKGCDCYVDALPFRPIFDYSYAGVMRSYADSIQRLGTDAIDILYIHDIGAVTHGDTHAATMAIAMTSGYTALDELRRNGNIKGFGLGVNEWQVCVEAMQHGHWDVFLLAGRYSLLEQSPVNTLLPLCQQHGSAVVLGGVFNSGILASSEKSSSNYNYQQAPAHIIDKAEQLAAICSSHNTQLPAAALHFAHSHPAIASVLLGGNSLPQLKQNIGWINQPVPPQLWQAMQQNGLIQANVAIDNIRHQPL